MRENKIYKRPAGITFFAGCFFIRGAFLFLLSAWGLVELEEILSAWGLVELKEILSAWGLVELEEGTLTLPSVLVLQSGLAGLAFVVGYGLWNSRKWARILAILYSLPLLFAFPLGTVFPIVIIWYLNKKSVKEHFVQTARKQIRIKSLRKCEGVIEQAEKLCKRNKLQKAERILRYVFNVLTPVSKLNSPEKKCLGRSYLCLGTIAKNKGDHKKALPNYEKAIGLATPEPEWIGFLGSYFVSRKRKTPRAIDIYLKYLKQHRRKPPDQYGQEIRNILEPLSRLKESDTQRVVNRRIKLNERIAKADPGIEWGHYYLGLGYFKRGSLSRAKASLERALNLNPQRGLTRYYLGRVLLGQGETKTALDSFRVCLKHEPKHSDANFYLGKVLVDQITIKDYEGSEYQAGELEEAIKHLTIAEDINNNPEYLFYLGSAYSLKKDHERAIKNLRESVSGDTKKDKYLYQLGAELYETGSYDEAKRTVNKAIKLSPGYHHAHLLLGCILYHLNNYEKARLELEPLLISDNKVPLSDGTKAAFFYLARSYDRLNIPQKAISIYKSLEKNPGAEEARYYLGCAQARGNRLNQALEQFNGIISRMK